MRVLYLKLRRKLTRNEEGESKLIAREVQMRRGGGRNEKQPSQVIQPQMHARYQAQLHDEDLDTSGDPKKIRPISQV
jgi:hypothetical protein